MKTTLRTDITIKEICKGFEYSESEGKGLTGWGNKLVIQPEYQRSYIYFKDKKEAPVIDSVLKGYPIGLIYFVKAGEDSYEVLDGQQRITSLGRFLTGKFAIIGENGIENYFDGLADDLQEFILNTTLTIYICEGTESEIKEWFKTINTAGEPLNEQEKLNAVYSGSFVTKAREEFSNSGNSYIDKWSAYIEGNVLRQDYLHTALSWVSDNNIDAYMSKHRRDNDIDELKTYFNKVIDWASSTFLKIYKEMRGINWDALYRKYHENEYDPETVSADVQALMEDYAVNNRKGIFEYVLGGKTDTALLDIRVFDKRTKKEKYDIQTKEAKEKKISNCPLCALGNNGNKSRIWELEEMEADHVKAWSTGGRTTIENCEMLCKIHNRAKGNK